MTSPRETVQKLADGISAGAWQDLHLLYAPDTIVRHPMARDRSAVLRGRAALRDHFKRFFATGLQLNAGPIRFTDTADPELVVATFTYHGTNGFGMDRFELEACFIWRVRNGLAVETTDYLSAPLAPRNGENA